MYKITKNGKTIVGNNEDWFSPNSQFWYEAADADQFGVMYMGFLNNFAQGAINEKGLVFDGFYEPYLAVNNTEGKTKISIAEAIRKVMQTMRSVEEVKDFLETIDLSSLTQSMIVFVDQSGTYLIVEGDEIWLGEEPEKSFSNFYYSQTESLDKVNLDYFQSGRKFVATSKSEPSLAYCGEAMRHFSQAKIAATQYSTIYDLTALTIRVYLFHDYSQFVEIDLKKELSKGNHKTMIPALFPQESIGYKHYQKYNNPAHPTLFIEEMIGTEKISEAEFNAMQFANILIPIGYEWLDDQKNPSAAIKVFEYGLSLMPNNADLYYSLGAAYFERAAWHKAIKSYAQSLVLNPENEAAIEKLVACRAKKNQPQTDYLGQTAPGLTPQVFAPEVISTEEYEFGAVFNAAVTEFYYGVNVGGRAEIRYSQRTGDQWSKPKTMLSHERYDYNDPFLSPDEQRLYFISKRALDGLGKLKDYDIWYVERTTTGWSEPINAGLNINSKQDEYYISFTQEGTMYFASNVKPKAGSKKADHDIYYSKFTKGKFQKAVALSDRINTPAYEADVFVAPDESYLIFCSTRKDGFGQGDLYISFKKPDGSWSTATNMGPKINTKTHELCPFVTADGKYFFYTSNKDIYWVSTDVFGEMRGEGEEE